MTTLSEEMGALAERIGGTRGQEIFVLRDGVRELEVELAEAVKKADAFEKCFALSKHEPFKGCRPGIHLIYSEDEGAAMEKLDCPNPENHAKGMCVPNERMLKSEQLRADMKIAHDDLRAKVEAAVEYAEAKRDEMPRSLPGRAAIQAVIKKLTDTDTDTPKCTNCGRGKPAGSIEGAKWCEECISAWEAGHKYAMVGHGECVPRAKVDDNIKWWRGRYTDGWGCFMSSVYGGDILASFEDILTDLGGDTGPTKVNDGTHPNCATCTFRSECSEIFIQCPLIIGLQPLPKNTKPSAPARNVGDKHRYPCPRCMEPAEYDTNEEHDGSANPYWWCRGCCIKFSIHIEAEDPEPDTAPSAPDAGFGTSWQSGAKKPDTAASVARESKGPMGICTACSNLPRGSDECMETDCTARPPRLKDPPALWRLQGYDTFSAEYYPLDGEYTTEMEARTAAHKRLEELEKSQPSISSGGQGGIQDRVYILAPSGGKQRIFHIPEDPPSPRILDFDGVENPPTCPQCETNDTVEFGEGEGVWEWYCRGCVRIFGELPRKPTDDETKAMMVRIKRIEIEQGWKDAPEPEGGE